MKDSPCALAGQTGGAIRLSLIFLVLFASRQKEQKKLHVRWPAKSSGAFAFGCPFLCFFLLGKQKKERNRGEQKNIHSQIIPSGL